MQLKNQMEEEMKPTRKLSEKITVLQEDIKKNVSGGNCAVLGIVVVLAVFFNVLW